LTTVKKLSKVKEILIRYPGVVVAFSGGVDSTLLLKIAKMVLKENVIAVTAVSPIHPKAEIAEAKSITKKLKCKHILFKSKELKSRTFINNPINRCYLCKLAIFRRIKEIAHTYRYKVMEASNISDLKDYRPGLKALKELDVQSPFIVARISKKDIRQLAKRYHLPNWDKPAAACLVSRIPYGKRIDMKILKRIESSEKYLKKLGIYIVRVRDHYHIARI
jgi:uncharacterized protein